MNCIIFYSNKCDSCKSLFTILHNENIINLFNKTICVDNIHYEKLAKMGINHVPTIIVKGNNGTSALYERLNAFIWIENILKYRNNSELDISTNLIDGYKKEELQGISDQYAYLHTDMAHPKSFLPYGKDDLFRILTSPTNDNDKINTKDQNELLDKIKNIRNKQIDDIKYNMEQNQLEILNNKL